jgi:hypothetical protein
MMVETQMESTIKLRENKLKKFLLLFSSETATASAFFKTLSIKLHKTIIWPFIFYGCEIWRLTARRFIKCLGKYLELGQLSW